MTFTVTEDHGRLCNFRLTNSTLVLLSLSALAKTTSAPDVRRRRQPRKPAAPSEASDTNELARSRSRFRTSTRKKEPCEVTALPKPFVSEISSKEKASSIRELSDFQPRIGRRERRCRGCDGLWYVVLRHGLSQCEIHDSMTVSASCRQGSEGTLTLPMACIFFLPAACFCSSFFLPAIVRTRLLLDVGSCFMWPL